MYHNGSQADDLDSSFVQNDVFPPAPVATNRPTNDIHSMQNEVDMQMAMGPMAANSVLGGSFGSSFQIDREMVSSIGIICNDYI